ncbi:MAG TPA: aminoglycoside phosphotransferase family protein [Nitrolancea sp.]|nr:aminoglycoside phosphotransferase family protein [Nitrolancea sp.]
MRPAGWFAGGQQGAFAVVDDTGQRFALKWRPTGRVEPFQDPRSATELLRAHGYPVPRYIYEGTVAGRAYAIQEVLPGAPMGQVDARYLPRLLELNDLQAGLAPSPSRAWPVMIARSVLEGFDEYCVIASLRDHSSSTAALLAHLQALVRASADVALPTSDIVHFDFHTTNILVDNDQISGVIDWDGPCAGDRAFDLATLLFYAGDQPELRATLTRLYLDRSSLAALQLYLAHMIVRQVDWSLRYQERAVVDHWLGVSRTLANELLDFR